MENRRNIETTEWLSGLVDKLGEPVVLEQDGQPKAVLMSIEDYRQYQALLSQREFISLREARRAANRAVFGELVGCPLSCGEPLLVPQPSPHWQIPYRLFDGTLMITVEVDAHSGTVSLTEQERADLLERVRQAVIANGPA